MPRGCPLVGTSATERAGFQIDDVDVVGVLVASSSASARWAEHRSAPDSCPAWRSCAVPAAWPRRPSSRGCRPRRRPRSACPFGDNARALGTLAAAMRVRISPLRKVDDDQRVAVGIDDEHGLFRRSVTHGLQLAVGSCRAVRDRAHDLVALRVDDRHRAVVPGWPRRHAARQRRLPSSTEAESQRSTMRPSGTAGHSCRRPRVEADFREQMAGQPVSTARSTQRFAQRQCRSVAVHALLRASGVPAGRENFPTGCFSRDACDHPSCHRCVKAPDEPRQYPSDAGRRSCDRAFGLPPPARGISEHRRRRRSRNRRAGLSRLPRAPARRARRSTSRCRTRAAWR